MVSITTKRTPPAIAGRVMGNVTVKNAEIGPLPRVRAVSNPRKPCWMKAARARR